MKLKYYISLLILCIASTVNAQTVQKGVVKEYNEKDQKTPLGGVEFDISSANSTVSDKDGGFNLNFNRSLAIKQKYLDSNHSEIVSLKEIIKTANAWVLNGGSFIILENDDKDKPL